MRAITFDIESVSDSMVRGHVDVNEQVELRAWPFTIRTRANILRTLKKTCIRSGRFLSVLDMLIGFN